MNVLKNPDICPRLFSIINQGPLIDGDGGVLPLGAKYVLELMEARCKRINGAFSEEEDQDGRGRIYVKELALPLRRSCEIDLRKSTIFQETAVDWQNTSMK